MGVRAKKKPDDERALAKIAAAELPADWEQQMFADANAAAVASSTAFGTGAKFISIQGGVFSMGKEVLRDSRGPLGVVVLDQALENAYYTGAFDPDNPASPVCFALGFVEGDAAPEMVPHPDAPEPQAEKCSACQHNAFGSGENGKGKACKNSIRLAMISTSHPLAPDAEIVQIKLPPTSGGGWAKYVGDLKSMFKRPPYGVRTELFLEPAKRGAGGVVVPRMAENHLVEKTFLGSIFALRQGTRELLMRPFQARTDDAPPTTKTKGQRRAAVADAPRRAAPKAPAAPPPVRGARSTGAPMPSRKF